jgi:multidrug efflux pump subunit AcrA (membrane-fusion protein)
VVPQPGPTQADLDAALAKIAELEASLAAAASEAEAALAAASAGLKASFKGILEAFEAKENADVETAKAEVDAL